MGNIIRRTDEEGYVGWDMWLGWREKGGLYRPWTGVRRGNVEEANRERTGRKP